MSKVHALYVSGETRGEIVSSGEQNSTVRRNLIRYEMQRSANPSNRGADYPLRNCYYQLILSEYETEMLDDDPLF